MADRAATKSPAVARSHAGRSESATRHVSVLRPVAQADNPRGRPATAGCVDGLRQTRRVGRGYSATVTKQNG